MAVAALLHLKDQRAFSLKCGTAMQELLRHRISAPRIHVRAPGCVSSEVGECSQDYGDQQNRQNCDRPPAPTLVPLSGKKWQQNNKRDNDYGTTEESRRLH